MPVMTESLHGEKEIAQTELDEAVTVQSYLGAQLLGNSRNLVLNAF